MKLNNQRRIASTLLKRGKTAVKFSPDKLAEIKEAITKADIRSLINDGSISSRLKSSPSKGRLRKRLVQKRKGRQSGKGRKKGRKTSRLSKKDSWMIKTRIQRQFIRKLKSKNKISSKTYRELYSKIKGNYFRSKSHIKLYLTENKLFVENVKK